MVIGFRKELPFFSVWIHQEKRNAKKILRNRGGPWGDDGRLRGQTFIFFQTWSCDIPNCKRG